MNLKKIKPYSNILALISSNLFLALAFYFYLGEGPKNQIQSGHKLIIFPIDNYVPLEEKGFVGLYDEFNSLIIKKAILHSKQPENSENYLIELEENDLNKIISFKGKKLRAFPTTEGLLKNKGENLEFTF
jgi:hypothetical protein